MYRLEKCNFGVEKNLFRFLNCEEPNLNKIIFKIFSYIPYTNPYA